ncbi:MAG: hypothetical protein DRO98_00790 [Archaeoglobales archaeon]|nr:MAG: hypothetical protein DRO98_00790 [Archaeoglobales archaeon]
MGIEEIMNGRRAMYSLLGQLFLNYPRDEFLRDIYDGVEIPLPPHPLIREGLEEIRKYAASFPAFEDFAKSVRVEYTQLFAAPDARVSPYQSSYENDSPYGVVTLRIRERFFDAGYKLNANEPADHIGIELLFMAETSNDKDIKKQNVFFEEELLKWVFKFCSAVESCSEAKFYRGVSKILRGFIEMEKLVIKRLLTL